MQNYVATNKFTPTATPNVPNVAHNPTPQSTVPQNIPMQNAPVPNVAPQNTVPQNVAPQSTVPQSNTPVGAEEVPFESAPYFANTSPAPSVTNMGGTVTPNNVPTGNGHFPWEQNGTIARPQRTTN